MTNLFKIKHFKLSTNESNSRFYKALNGIYSKSKGNMIEMVTFQLINAYCKPLLTCACQCVKFNRSDLSQLVRAWNSVFWKVFNTYDKDCIVDIQISISQLPISMDIDTRKMKYISKLKLSKNQVLAELFNISVYLQLTKLLSDYNMPDVCNNFKDGLLTFLL